MGGHCPGLSSRGRQKNGLDGKGRNRAEEVHSSGTDKGRSTWRFFTGICFGEERCTNLQA